MQAMVYVPAKAGGLAQVVITDSGDGPLLDGSRVDVVAHRDLMTAEIVELRELEVGPRCT